MEICRHFHYHGKIKVMFQFCSSLKSPVFVMVSLKWPEQQQQQRKTEICTYVYVCTPYRQSCYSTRHTKHVSKTSSSSWRSSRDGPFFLPPTSTSLAGFQSVKITRVVGGVVVYIYIYLHIRIVYYCANMIIRGREEMMKFSFWHYYSFLFSDSMCCVTLVNILYI